MRHIKSFNESKLSFFFKNKIDWKFVKNIEDILTAYLDAGKEIEMSLICGEAIIYAFNDEHRGTFENDSAVDFNGLEDMGFAVSITMYVKRLELKTDRHGFESSHDMYEYLISYPYTDLNFFIDEIEMRSYIENGLYYHLQISNDDGVETNLDKYENFAADLFEKLKSKFKKFTWMRQVSNELYLVPIEHNFTLK